MVFRKPWLFLIKHFKLIHLMMLVLMIYALLKTNNIYRFFKEYVADLRYVYNFSLTNEYFSNTFLFLVFVIIVFVSILILLFKIKKKPWFLYLMILCNYLILMILLVIGFDIFKSMEFVTPNIRYVTLVRDLFFASIGLQYITVFFTTTRALGFDIKRFNFATDIADLKAEEKDNEEFEIEVNVDADKYRKKWNAFLREAKAIAVEQKYILMVLSSIIIAWIGVSVYIDFGINRKIYAINDAVKINSIELAIDKTYTTNTDIKNNIIMSTEEDLIVVLFSLKNSSDVSNTLDVRKMSLLYNRIEYRPDLELYDQLNDFGYGFLNQEIRNTQGGNYYVVFKVPKVKEKSYAYFRYDKVISSVKESIYYRVKVDIKPKAKNNNQETVKLNEMLSFDKTSIAGTTVIIKDYKIGDKFTESYKVNGVAVTEEVIPKNDTSKVLKLETDVKYKLATNTDYFTSKEDLYEYYATVYYVDANEERASLKADIIDNYNLSSPYTYLNVPLIAGESDILKINFNIRGIEYWVDLKKK